VNGNVLFPCLVFLNFFSWTTSACVLFGEINFVVLLLAPLRTKQVGEFIKNGHKKFHPPV
jgi:hypothetical protein